MLTIYTFDDSNVSDSMYIGVVQIPLIALAHGKEIEGGFELVNVGNIGMWGDVGGCGGCVVWWWGGGVGLRSVEV